MEPSSTIPQPSQEQNVPRDHSGPGDSKDIVITSVNIVDVENGAVIPKRSVLIHQDRIAKIGSPEEVKVPVGALCIHGDGLYLMPGLVDAHVHYYDAAVFGRLMLANGVLLVRDTGMPNEYILPLRDKLNQGTELGPEMIATGSMLDGNPPIIPIISAGILTCEEGRAAVHHQVQAGADMIKVYSRLDGDVFLAVLDEAHKLGLKVMAHLPESVYLEDAAAAGLDSNEHFNGFEKVIAKLLGDPVNLTFRGQAADAGYFWRLDEVDHDALLAVYQRLLTSGMTLCPTVVTFKTMTHVKQILAGNFAHSEFISPALRQMWGSFWGQHPDVPDFIWQNWSQMVKDLASVGIPMMTGTDLMLPGIIPGFSLHEEMAIWQGAGIPPADILRSATWVPARFFGLSDRLGSIREGKVASVVLARANPLEDIANAQQIEAVFLRGCYLSRPDLDHLLQEAQDLACSPVPG